MLDGIVLRDGASSGPSSSLWTRRLDERRLGLRRWSAFLVGLGAFNITDQVAFALGDAPRRDWLRVPSLRR